MPGKIILSAGMPRAGSGWYFNLTNDLLTAAGYQDARQIRKRFGLQSILTEVNCNIRALSLPRLIPVLLPVILGNTFAIKTHAAPNRFVYMLIRLGLIKPTYIYRDPRDALLSAYEYGQRSREAHRTNAFAELDSLEKAISFIKDYVMVSDAWLDCQASLHTRYENLLTSYPEETWYLADFLEVDKKNKKILAVFDQYQPEKGGESQKGLHLYKGRIGRFREVFTPEQKALCLEVFEPYLLRIGYPL